jgi:hypothetical protein
MAMAPRKIPSVVTTSKKISAFSATRPTPRNSPWPAIPVTSPPKMSGATIMRIRRRKMSLRNRVCIAKCGASAPSSAPATMAKKVHTSSERRFTATGTKSARPAQRKTAPTSARTRNEAARIPAANNTSAAAASARSASGKARARPVLPGAFTVSCGSLEVM